MHVYFRRLSFYKYGLLPLFFMSLSLIVIIYAERKAGSHLIIIIHGILLDLLHCWIILYGFFFSSSVFLLWNIITKKLKQITAMECKIDYEYEFIKTTKTLIVLLIYVQVSLVPTIIYYTTCEKNGEKSLFCYDFKQAKKVLHERIQRQGKITDRVSSHRVESLFSKGRSPPYCCAVLLNLHMCYVCFTF